MGPTDPIGPRGAVGRLSTDRLLAACGCRGRAWAAHWRDAYATTVLTHTSYHGPTARADRRAHAAARPLIETITAHLTAEVARPFPIARFAAKLLAFNLGEWCNRLLRRPFLAVPTLVAA